MVVKDVHKDFQNLSISNYDEDETVGHEEKCVFVGLCLNLMEQIHKEVAFLDSGSWDVKFAQTAQQSFEQWSINLTVRILNAFDIGHASMERIDRERRGASNHSYSQFLIDCLGREERSRDLLCHLLSASLVQTGFDARTAVLVDILAGCLKIPPEDYAWQVERHVLQPIKGGKMQDDQDLSGQDQPRRHRKRLILSGIGAAVGGTLVAATAGLAAPFVAPALASVFGLGGLAAFVASTGGIVTVSLLFGAAGAGLTGYKVSKRFGCVADFSFVPVNTYDRLGVVLGISGWLKTADDVWRPWINRSVLFKDNIPIQNHGKCHCLGT